MLGSIITLIILTLINGVFAATEFAFLSLNKVKVKMEVKKGDKRSIEIDKMLNDSSEFLSTIQIGITISGFLASGYAANYFADYFMKIIGNTVIPSDILNNILVFIITIILSYFVLVFGELVPKKIAMNYPYKISYSMVYIIKVLMVIFYPFIKILTLTTNLICKLFHIKDNKTKITEEDIKQLIISGTYEGVIEEKEKEYMFNIFEFNDKEVKDVMTPKEDSIVIDAHLPKKEIIEIIRKNKYTRYPVYDYVNNKILGILNVKDLILYYKDNSSLDIEDILHETISFDYKEKIDDVFRKMQKEHISMAIVTNKEFIGLVTLEDAVEEIVGNMYDEYDNN